LLQATFGVGLKGVKKEDVEKVEQLVLVTLRDIADKGFDQDAIDASLNTYEFRLREFNTGSFPKGLSVMLGMLSQWIYDGSPTEAIRFEGPLQEIKQDLKDGKPVFQDTLKKYFLSNEHRVTVEMVPIDGLEVQQNNDEILNLQRIKESMTPEDIQKVIESTQRLKEAQLAEDRLYRETGY
jgi:Zn-dependent M16 (insulinase) family peptidase